MAAILRTSHEFDNPARIADDLLYGLAEMPPGALGILVCDSMIDSKTLIALLGKKLPFPIVGGTTLSFPFSFEDEATLSASFLVFAKENASHSIALSEKLDESKSREQMQSVFRNCLNALEGEPKLILPFFPLMPGLLTDKFINELFSLAGTTPVFGGVTTNDLIQTKAAVFINGETVHDKMVLVMLAGNIEPVFAVGNQVTCMAEYGPLPVLLSQKMANDDGVAEIRCISRTNVEDGSVTFSSSLPVGTRVNVGVLQKEDVIDSVQHSLATLLGKMKQKELRGYKFEALVCVSCVARYFALVGADNFERQLLNQSFPNTVAVSSYYGFCEIGPTGHEDAGLTNRSHNASIIMCAF